MPLAIAPLVFVVFQIVIRMWLRLRPRAIPFGWSWRLENLERRYLAQTRAKLSDLGDIGYSVGDARDLRLEGVADVIVLISALPEIPEPLLALEACKLALKTDGRIVIGEELFEPEYVTAQQTDARARAVGLGPIVEPGARIELATS